MRCNECNRMASYDLDSEPEVELEIDGDCHISGTVRIVLTHDECGNELKEHTFDVEEDFEMEHRPFTCCKECNIRQDAEQFFLDKSPCALEGKAHEWEEVELNADDHEQEIVDEPTVHLYSRNTAKYRKQRGKTFYGFEGEVEVKCSCGTEKSIPIKDEIQASDMEECN